MTIKITKVFTTRFHYMLLSKWRHFYRRSLLRYIVAALLATVALHFNHSLSVMQWVIQGGINIMILVSIATILIVLFAYIQSRRPLSRTLTFSENNLVVDDTSCPNWSLIANASLYQHGIAFVLKDQPRLEWFLPEQQLTDAEFSTLNTWFARHGKLPKS